MPFKPKHPCNYPGCPALTAGRYCEDHDKQAKKVADKKRETANARGYNSKWAKVRIMKLNQDPLCERCESAAILVHHKDRNPFNNGPDNLLSLCDACHDTEHKDDVWVKRG